MPRRFKISRLLMLLAVAGVAGAQSDFDVTMRVVDDTRDLNAVVIVIGADAIEIRSDALPAGGAVAPAQ